MHRAFMFVLAVTGGVRYRLVRRKGLGHPKVFSAVLVVVASVWASPAWAGTGQPDQGFGIGGVAQVSGLVNGEEGALAVASNGDILVAGIGQQGSDYQVEIAAMLPDGQPDLSFGADGVATTPLGAAAPLPEGNLGEYLAVTPQGYVLLSVAEVPESSSGSTGQGYVQVFEFTPSGAHYANFGTNGMAQMSLDTISDTGGLAVTPTGDILVGVTGKTDSAEIAGAGAIFALLPTGQPDDSFGSNGMISLGQLQPFTLAVDDQGRILVAGAQGSSYASVTGVVERLYPGGQPDATFGSGGQVLLNQRLSNRAPVGIAVGVSGDVFLSVTPYVSADHEVLALTPSGSPDPAFGIDGYVSIARPGPDLEFSNDVIADAAGGFDLGGADRLGLVVAQFDQSGQPDRSFGTNGMVTVPLANSQPVDAEGVVALADSDVVSGADLVARSSSEPTGPVLGGVATGSGAGPTSPATVSRWAGSDRIATAIAISQASFPTAPSGGTGIPYGQPGHYPYAGCVVLASADSFADALVGVPLASEEFCPLLLTDPTSLDPRVLNEINRVLGGGSSAAQIDVLGGTGSISDSIVGQLVSAGYQVARLAGSDRYQTSVAVAEAEPWDGEAAFEADGTGFADALSAGAAASMLQAPLLLTDGTTMPSSVSQYLAANPPGERFAIGGPAAQADPGATPVVGADRYATAVDVADSFFITPSAFGLATGTDYPDALAGGPALYRAGGPILLTPPSGLPSEVSQYLTSHAPWIDGGLVLGGTNSVSTATQEQAQSDLNQP